MHHHNHHRNRDEERQRQRRDLLMRNSYSQQQIYHHSDNNLRRSLLSYLNSSANSLNNPHNNLRKLERNDNPSEMVKALSSVSNPFFSAKRYPLPGNGTLFITTEDPAVLAAAEEFAKQNHWKISYTNLFDRSKQTASKTWDEQHKKNTVAVHDDLEYMSMLLNLYISSKCEAWVCTIASNSCRIMDEIRATIGGKANRHYADISKETCEDVPCVNNYARIKQFGE